MRKTQQQRLTRQQKRLIRELVAKHDPLIRQAFEAAIQNARDALDFDALVAAVKANNLAQAVELLRINQAFLWPLDEAVRTAFYAGAATVTQPKGIAGKFSFNGRHVRAEKIIAEIGANLVTEIGSPGPEAIRAVLLEGAEQSAGARKVAQNLAGKVNPVTKLREGGIMGLDGPRASRLQAVTSGMKTPEGVKGLVTRHRDGTLSVKYKVNRATELRILRAYKAGEAVPAADRLISEKQYSNQLLKARGRAIAEHEAFTAQAQGRREAYQQLLDSGEVESIGKWWQHNSAKDARPDHKALDGKIIGFDEAFEMDDGARLQYAHDPAGGIVHSGGCRCTTTYIPQYKRG